MGDSARLQAITWVNDEQASKSVMQEPTRLPFGEGRSDWNRPSEQTPSDLPGSRNLICAVRELQMDITGRIRSFEIRRVGSPGLRKIEQRTELVVIEAYR
jgi:hypothetical protein